SMMARDRKRVVGGLDLESLELLHRLACLLAKSLAPLPGLVLRNPQARDQSARRPLIDLDACAAIRRIGDLGRFRGLGPVEDGGQLDALESDTGIAEMKLLPDPLRKAPLFPHELERTVQDPVGGREVLALLLSQGPAADKQPGQAMQLAHHRSF